MLFPGAENFQRAVFTDGIRPIENPVLPGGEAAEDARGHGLAVKAQACLHASPPVPGNTPSNATSGKLTVDERSSIIKISSQANASS